MLKLGKVRFRKSLSRTQDRNQIRGRINKYLKVGKLSNPYPCSPLQVQEAPIHHGLLLRNIPQVLEVLKWLFDAHSPFIQTELPELQDDLVNYFERDSNPIAPSIYIKTLTKGRGKINLHLRIEKIAPEGGKVPNYRMSVRHGKIEFLEAFNNIFPMAVSSESILFQPIIVSIDPTFYLNFKVLASALNSSFWGLNIPHFVPFVGDSILKKLLTETEEDSGLPICSRSISLDSTYFVDFSLICFRHLEDNRGIEWEIIEGYFLRGLGRRPPPRFSIDLSIRKWENRSKTLPLYRLPESLAERISKLRTALVRNLQGVG